MFVSQFGGFVMEPVWVKLSLYENPIAKKGLAQRTAWKMGVSYMRAGLWCGLAPWERNLYSHGYPHAVSSVRSDIGG